jgi:hypothetical protein
MDPAGGAVPGAEIKATQTEIGVSRFTTSGADGIYALANLATGPYRVEVTKPGFSTYVQTGIVLQVASNPTLNVSLKIGAVNERIQVEANVALVETQTTSIGGVIERKRILELPLNGRNAVELIPLTGATIPAGRNGTAGFPGGLNFSVAGGQLSGIGYFLDGTSYNNLFDAVNLPFPFPDALQEFKVETSTLTAQNGTHSAAAVSAVVWSGTNQFHGSAFEFLRNAKMNARNFAAPRRDTLKRNQYGGTFGGPVMKNKLFFFTGYQGTKTRSDPADLSGFVPTAQMLAGDFSGCPSFGNLTDPASTSTPKAIFPGRQIPVSLFSPQAQAIAALLPKTTDPCGKTPFGPVTKINDYQVLGRVDYQISERQQIFGRYMATAFLQPASYGFSKNLLDTIQGGLDDLAQTFTLGHTFLISPTTVNQFRTSANRVAVHRFNDDYFSGCDLKVKMYCYLPHQTVVGVSGGPVIGTGTAVEARFVPTSYTLSDDVNFIRGSHQLAFGYSGFKYQHSHKANVSSVGSFTFSGTQFTGLGLADFLLGQAISFQQSTPNTVFTTKWGHSLYGQDTWKVSRRLTVNLGVRWEPFLPQSLNNGAVFTFSQDRFNKGVHSTVFKNAPAGLLYAGDPGFEGNTGVNKRFNQFAPRIGAAFDPTGNGKTSIRASFGMAYDFPSAMIMSTPATAPPFASTVSIPGPVNFGDPYANYPGGNPFPGNFAVGPNVPFVAFGSYVAQQPDAKGTTVLTWNFAVQHQFAKDWLVSATYLGTETSHLWVSFQLNPADPTVPGASTTNTNLRRITYLRNPAANEGGLLGPVDQFESGGTASYNGMILAVQKRLSRGVSLNANYTWSHCIGDVTIGSYIGISGGTYSDANNRRRDRGNCQTLTTDTTSPTQAFDRRHIANFNAVLESPRFERPILRAVASDWRLSPSYRLLSGAYQTVGSGGDNALTGGQFQRPNQVLVDPLVANPGSPCANTSPCVSWINRDAFQQPVNGTFGNLGRSNVPGPGFWTIDVALSRGFLVGENVHVELRGEAFNLTNSYRAGIVTTNLTLPSFGRILTAQDPRIMQVALKLAF